MKAIKRFLPISIIIILIVSAYLVGFANYLTLKNFEQVHHAAMNFVGENPYLAPLIFMGIYIIYAALCLPGIILLTILGGYLFQQPLSTIYVLFSATLGGSILFLSTRRASEDFLSRNAGVLCRMEKKFQANPVRCMLFLRLVPLFPCWFVTVTSGIFGLKYTTFLWTTFIGIMPCVILLTSMGMSIMMMMEKGAFWTWHF